METNKFWLYKRLLATWANVASQNKHDIGFFIKGLVSILSRFEEVIPLQLTFHKFTSLKTLDNLLLNGGRLHQIALHIKSVRVHSQRFLLTSCPHTYLSFHLQRNHS